MLEGCNQLFTVLRGFESRAQWSLSHIFAPCISAPFETEDWRLDVVTLAEEVGRLLCLTGADWHEHDSAIRASRQSSARTGELTNNIQGASAARKLFSGMVTRFISGNFLPLTRTSG
jgi:hypothetical protein